MNLKKLFRILLFFCIIAFISCGDNDERKKEIYSLSFEKEYYEAPLLWKKSILVRGGNRDYTVAVEKTNILDASMDISSLTGMGSLVINPKQKGETTVTVKDNITKETVVLKIKVIDTYLAYAITKSNHPALSQGTIVYLINNEAKDCYFFRYEDSGLETYSMPTAKGTYGFSTKKEYGIGNSSLTYFIPYLTLNYVSDEQGSFTEVAIQPTPHQLRFEMYDGTTNNVVISMIQACLSVDWKVLTQEALKGTKSDVHQPMLKTTIDDTDYVIIGTLNTTPTIPESILE